MVNIRMLASPPSKRPHRSMWRLSFSPSGGLFRPGCMGSTAFALTARCIPPTHRWGCRMSLRHGVKPQPCGMIKWNRGSPSRT
eukprot:12922900-Prorocentrum_lima.AAC.1